MPGLFHWGLLWPSDLWKNAKPETFGTAAKI